MKTRLIVGLAVIWFLSNVAADWMSVALWQRFEASQYFPPADHTPLVLIGYALIAVIAAFVGPMSALAVSLGLMLVAAATQDRAAPGVALLLVTLATASVAPAVSAAAVRLGGSLARATAALVLLHGAMNVSFLAPMVGFAPAPESAALPAIAVCAVALAIVVALGTGADGTTEARAPAPFHWPTLVALPLFAGAAGLQTGLYESGLTLQSEQFGPDFEDRLYAMNSVIVVLAALPLAAFLRSDRWRDRYLPLGLLGAAGLALSALSAVPLLGLAGRATSTPFLVLITLGEMLTLPILLARIAVGHSWRTTTAVVAAYEAGSLFFTLLAAFLRGYASDPVWIGTLAGLLVGAAVALVALELYATRWLWPEAVAPTAEDALVPSPPAPTVPDPPPAART